MATLQKKCTIPVIDLLDFPNQLPMLIEASEEWGCFRLVNFHQVLPLTLMAEMKDVIRSLFDLPTYIKTRNVDVIVRTGYMAPSEINPRYESFGLYDMACRSDVEAFCSQLEASNQQREIVKKYAGAAHELLVRMAEKLAQGLGIRSDTVGFDNWPCQFRINKYHFTPGSVGLGGVQLHTDTGFLTILQDDEIVGGLQVIDKAGDTIPVEPWPGTLVVNLGDMARIWSNGRFLNVKHKVECVDETIRLSTASFLLGPRGIVKPLPELVDADHPAAYLPTTLEDSRTLRNSTGWQAGEALKLLEIRRDETDEPSSSHD
ncbi:hypothetical protein OSB04_028239 [Centaurea solstitialis]|uniref:2-oxoglutarate-dependent dioxygenase DAO n=1 Tax=Centaurea solstitialis TaxID=347529 RepID=A0AA38T072_9ASTR|nr:hypothetical protein OSB04_028239 [Centaurea solstitialis]